MRIVPDVSFMAVRYVITRKKTNQCPSGSTAPLTLRRVHRSYLRQRTQTALSRVSALSRLSHHIWPFPGEIGMCYHSFRGAEFVSNYVARRPRVPAV